MAVWKTIAVALGACTLASSAWAQSAAEVPESTAPVQEPEDDADLRPDPSQPDFTIIGLPTTLRLPKYRSGFRVTHRFTRPLGEGDAGDLIEDFFGFDSSALIGLEFRFGLAPGLQTGIHRTSDRTIQFFGQYSVVGQDDSHPLGVDAIVTVEGFDNFTEEYSTAVGALVSRKLGRFGAIYFEPIWVGNTNPFDSTDDDNSTFMFGLGGRVRIRPTVYVVGEIAPRAGYDPGVMHGSFGVEKRVGGHAFQLNFSDSFGTTLGQIARGGFDGSDWYIGFNISRKFF
jgi:hypothetical protein